MDKNVTPDHYKKECPKNKATCGNHCGNNDGVSGGATKKWYNSNKEGKTEMKKNGTTCYWCKTCGFGKKG